MSLLAPDTTLRYLNLVSRLYDNPSSLPALIRLIYIGSIQPNLYFLDRLNSSLYPLLSLFGQTSLPRQV